MPEFSDEELKKRLTEEEYNITQKKHTEAPFTGEYYKTDMEGMYKCKVCSEPLFESETKFDAGCGWPSFYQPVAEEKIGKNIDRSLLEERIEVVCKNCGAHLGHVFDDGPAPTGKRYCINSASLKLDPKK